MALGALGVLLASSLLMITSTGPQPFVSLTSTHGLEAAPAEGLLTSSMLCASTKGSLRGQTGGKGSGGGWGMSRSGEHRPRGSKDRKCAYPLPLYPSEGPSMPRGI